MQKNDIAKIEAKIEAIEKRIAKLLDENVKDIKELKVLLSELEEYKKDLEIELKDAILSIMPEVIKKDLKDSRIKELEGYFKMLDNYDGINKFCNVYSLLYILSDPEDLNKFNSVLKELINVFKEYNIILTKEDFDLTIHVKDYMSKFFDNIEQDRFFDNMKNEFDKIYWNSHELLNDIVLNIKIIVFNNVDNMLNVLRVKIEEYVKKHNINELTAKEEYDKLIINKNSLLAIDPVEILESIKNNEIDVEAITEDSGAYIGAITTFTTEEKYKLLDKEDFFSNIIKLKNNLKEYEFYGKYNYLVSFIAEIAEKKEDYKTIYSDKKDRIKKLLDAKKDNNNNLNKLLKEKEEINSKQTSLFFNKKKKINSLNKLETAINEMINKPDNTVEELRKEFENYELDLFEEKSSLSINKGYTILDDFLLFKNNVFVLNEIIKKYELNLTNDELKLLYDRFHDTLKMPSIQIINSFNFYKEEDLSVSIKNKYKLININFDLNYDNVSDLIKSCDTIIDYYNVSKCGIEPEIIVIIDKYYIKRNEENAE